jgi:hypothetical protein
VKTGDEDQGRQRIEQEVHKTLAYLDNVESIESGPYVHTRILQGVKDAEDRSARRLAWGYRLAPALLGFLLVFNVATAWVVLRSAAEERSEYRDETVESLADEYRLIESMPILDHASGQEPK